MKRFIFLVIALIVSVFIGLKIAEDPGYVVFAYRNWTVEMPLWFALLSTVLLLLVFYLVLRFFDAIDATWASWKHWRWLRRKHKSYSKTNQGLIQLIEANWKSAEQYLMEGVDQSDAPLINFLAAAKAAHELGAYEKRDMYLRKAYDLSPQTHVAVGLMQAQLQLDQGKLEQSLATLNQLRREAPKQTLVLKLLERVYVHLGDWNNLLKLIPALRKAKLITADQMTMLECKTYRELLKAANKFGNVNAVRDIWRTIPHPLQKNMDLVNCYASLLAHYPDASAEVEELIAKNLKTNWSSELVNLYGLLKTPDSISQLKVAEKWQKQYPAQAVLYLTLARLSVRCQLWGKARSYFEESLRLSGVPETYTEYGNLLMQLHEENAAIQMYREGLQKLVEA
jgi:HemY protein